MTLKWCGGTENCEETPTQIIKKNEKELGNLINQITLICDSQKAGIEIATSTYETYNLTTCDSNYNLLSQEEKEYSINIYHCGYCYQIHMVLVYKFGNQKIADHIVEVDIDNGVFKLGGV